MVRQHGITAESYKRILMGPGAVYIGDPDYGTLLGTTKGGNVFEVNRTILDMRPDGALGKMKGFRRLDEVEAVLTVRLFEITEDIVNMALAGSSLNGIIIGGEISDESYIDLITIVAEVTGTDPVSDAQAVICKLKNCLVEGPLTFTLPEKGEAVVEVKFHAHFDSASPGEEPWEIEFVPVEGS